MRNIDLTITLQEAFDIQQGMFKPSEYRMALILLNPNKESLEAFFQVQVTRNLAQTEGIMSVTNASSLNQILGNEGSTIRRGIDSAIRVQNHLASNSNAVEESLIGTRDFIRSYVESEAIRYVEEISALKEVNNRRMIGLPDRLAKHRSLAEDALVKSLIDPVDKIDWLDDAINRLDEVVEQPIGAKDPFNWLLFAWAKQRKNDIGGSVHEALAQACLVSNATQDALFVEAHRSLAGYFASKSKFDKAATTLQKIIGSGEEYEALLEYVIYSASSTQQNLAITQYKQLVAQKPFTAFLPISNPAMGQNGGAWMNVVKEESESIVNEAAGQLSAWKVTLDGIESLADQHESIAEFLPQYNVCYEFLSERLKGSHIFEASYLSSESIRFHKDMELKVRKMIEVEKSQATHEIQSLELKKESLRRSRDESVAVLRGYRVIKEGQDRIDLNLAKDNSATMQKGCGTSLMTGFGGFGVYFIMGMFSNNFLNSAGPGTSTGKVIMGALLIPPALGGIMSIMDAIRKNTAHNELNRRGKEYDSEMEKRIAEIDMQFNSNLAELDSELNVIRGQLKTCEESGKKLSEIHRQHKRAA